jgi:peptidoglycan/LPS O-acetylase OafA/YrhL
MIEKADKAFPKDLPVLTSLRFYAALFTGLFHIQYLSGLKFPEPASQIMSKSYLAVDFFFILSGFILTHTYLKAYEEGTFSYRSFLVKRLARIYPVHIFTLILFCLCLMIMSSQGWPMHQKAFSLNDLIYNIFLVHAWNISDHLSYNMVSWSISAEWFAYLCFPVVLAYGIRLKDPLKYILLALGLMAGLWLWVEMNTNLTLTQLSPAGIFRIIPEFTLGVALYFWARDYQCPWSRDRTIGACLVLLLLLFVLDAPDYLAIPLLAAAILIGAEQARSGKSSFLTHPVNIYFGQTSYSFYMIQYVLWFFLMDLLVGKTLNFNNNELPIYCAWFLSLILVQLAAMALYHGVEKPSHQWIVKTASIKKLRSEDTHDPLI